MGAYLRRGLVSTASSPEMAGATAMSSAPSMAGAPQVGTQLLSEGITEAAVASAGDSPIAAARATAAQGMAKRPGTGKLPNDMTPRKPRRTAESNDIDAVQPPVADPRRLRPVQTSVPARKRSASSAAMQPMPALVIAWRKMWSVMSPAAKTPGIEVSVLPGRVTTYPP